MSIDFERLDAAITYAYEHPDKFHMDSWFKQWNCGATACLAGTAAIQLGWRPVWEAVPADWEADYVADAGDVEKDGVRKDVYLVAMVLLGLNAEDADRFFYATDLDEVIRRRNEYAAEAGIPQRVWDTP